ncbi:MAG: Uma2 family endonuclease [Rhodospirillales bacterium]|nr:Uma2 family endonuclease [Rhodospirillales bacterium]
MSQAALRRMTADEFLEWDLNQPDARHELIDGVPVAMTGARRRHDRIVVNGMRELSGRVRGKGCEAFTADIAVRVPNGNVRRPDIGIDCGPADDRMTYAGAPRLLVEVLSPSTRAFDLARKLEEYRSIAGLLYILLVDPDAPEAILWSREPGQSWQHAVIAGQDATIELPALGLALPMAELYAGIAFPEPS